MVVCWLWMPATNIRSLVGDAGGPSELSGVPGEWTHTAGAALVALGAGRCGRCGSTTPSRMWEDSLHLWGSISGRGFGDAVRAVILFLVAVSVPGCALWRDPDSAACDEGAVWCRAVRDSLG